MIRPFNAFPMLRAVMPKLNRVPLAPPSFVNIFNQSLAIRKYTTDTSNALNTKVSSPEIDMSKLVTPTEELVRYKAEYLKPQPESLLPLKQATSLYARIHVHTWDMLVTVGDIIKLPVNMHDLQVGDTLSFNECSEIGSRHHQLSGGDNIKNGRIDPTVFTIKGVVLEKSRVKRHVKETTRRRRRHVRHAVSKQSLTVMRIASIAIN
ncbi:mitochondrial 54S ribosomal protein YmL49 [Starmerella bacillaris]|uniref:Large ribosomal subunit protein bL21m n=1 Tax=Starmerella bacillaris TaxID=1247836 RepID=A0AAV5RKL5_STABA|nr:mitochondrial 54S ribosomal protein YmL49 [Starmerella bacillaris]